MLQTAQRNNALAQLLIGNPGPVPKKVLSGMRCGEGVDGGWQDVNAHIRVVRTSIGNRDVIRGQTPRLEQELTPVNSIAIITCFSELLAVRASISTVLLPRRGVTATIGRTSEQAAITGKTE
jgi:hypothetical protein